MTEDPSSPGGFAVAGRKQNRSVWFSAAYIIEIKYSAAGFYPFASRNHWPAARNQRPVTG